MSDEKVTCPEHLCGTAMNTTEEIQAHLQWDHNRSVFEAKQMVEEADTDE